MENNKKKATFYLSYAFDEIIQNTSVLKCCAPIFLHVFYIFEAILNILNVFFLFWTMGSGQNKKEYKQYQTIENPELFYVVGGELPYEFNPNNCHKDTYFQTEKAVSFCNSLNGPFFVYLTYPFSIFLVLITIRRLYQFFFKKPLFEKVKSSQEILMIYYLMAAIMKPQMSNDFDSKCLHYRGHIIPSEMFSYVCTFILGVLVVFFCIKRRCQGFYFSPFTVLFSLFYGIGEQMEPKTQANRYGGKIGRLVLYLTISLITVCPQIQFLNSSNTSTICTYSIGLFLALSIDIFAIQQHYFEDPWKALVELNQVYPLPIETIPSGNGIVQPSHENIILPIGSIPGYYKKEVVTFKTLTGRYVTLNYHEPLGGVFLVVNPNQEMQSVVVNS